MNNLHSKFDYDQLSNGIITVSITEELPYLSSVKSLFTKKDDSEIMRIKCQSSTYNVMESTRHVLFRYDDPEKIHKFPNRIKEVDSNKNIRKLYAEKGITSK